MTTLSPRWEVYVEMKRIPPDGLCGLDAEEVALESDFSALDSAEPRPGTTLFQVAGGSSETTWTTIDDRGVVRIKDWGNRLGDRGGSIGHIDASTLERMSKLRASALDSAFREPPGPPCAACAPMSYYACTSERPEGADLERCLLGRDGPAGVKHRASRAARTLLGWMLAVQRDVDRATPESAVVR